MSENSLSHELELATSAAKDAGKIILNYFKKDYQVRDKGHNNPVTTADLEADTFLRQTLLGEFPGDGWLSEETRDSAERLSKKRVWVVDPLDGTRDFVAGRPEFVVSIALVEDARPVIGIIYNPVTEELFTAVKDQPSQLNGAVISCSTKQQLNESTIYVSRSETRAGLWEQYQDLFKKRVVCGSVAYKLAHIAAAHGDLFVSLKPKNDWDICAGDLIVRNAGGITVNRKSDTIRYNTADPFIPHGLIAGPSQLVKRALPCFKITSMI
ncbi:MAG: 3'(2'),5'-bisphosphate nucleotidase CysQ [Candidatus Marinimicrobia bacterium]|nr:3'(2'),5'-bisphosphate nucleotidase CysQ [Candidatus Neomarinimicrobiota bacterium]